MKIKCKSKGLIVNYDNTVWPCCWICTNKRGNYLASLPKNWNSLDHHSLQDILSHEAFTKHYNIEHWQDKDKVDIECKEECSDNK